MLVVGFVVVAEDRLGGSTARGRVGDSETVRVAQLQQHLPYSSGSRRHTTAYPFPLLLHHLRKLLLKVHLVLATHFPVLVLYRSSGGQSKF